MPSAQKVARAEATFVMYAGLGPDRSLGRVRDVQVILGQKPLARSTLTDYSATFDWVRRAKEFDTKVAAARAPETVDLVVAMNERHARDAEAIQRVAFQGILKFGQQGKEQTLEEQGIGPLSLTYVRGATSERLARGEPTERSEIVMSVLNNVIDGLVTLFEEVNALPDPDERRGLFGRNADAIVDRELASAGVVVVPESEPSD